MPKKKKGPIIQGFPDKVAKKLPENYHDTVESLDNDEIKSARLEAQRVIDMAEHDMEEDQNLKNAKEDVKTLSGAYRDTIACEKAKVKYLLHVSRLRGYIA